MAVGEARYGIDPYLEWVNQEGVPVVEDIAVDLFEVPVAVQAEYVIELLIVNCQL